VVEPGQPTPVPVTLSLVTPVFRGREHLPVLVDRVDAGRRALEEQDAPLRLIEHVLVDDGSTDGSEEVLEQLASEHPWITVVTLSRNFGQHPATAAGMLHCAGEWIATLDEDLQHPPERVVDLLRAAVESRADLAYGRSAGRIHSGPRDLASRLFKRALVFSSGNADLALASSFRVVRGEVARGAAAAADHETYLDVALTWFTDRIVGTELDLHDDRYGSGRSGYGTRTLLSHARRALISSQTKLVRAAAVLGLLAVAVSGVLLVRTVVVVRSDVGADVPGWPSLFMTLLFFGGVLCVLLVVLLEYSMSSALHLKGKPTFFPVDRRRDEVLRRWFEHR